MNGVAVRCLAALAVLVATGVACSSAPAPAPPPAPAQAVAPSLPPASTSTVALAVGTTSRTAIVHRPAGLASGAPLVVVLHGAYGSGEQTRAVTGWDALADREGFVVAYPNGLWRTWNAGHCCGQAHVHNVDDVGFLHMLVDEMVTQEGIDRDRVYAVGLSNGAMMAYAWACGSPDDLAGIGAVAGALTADCPNPPAVNVVAIHGTADRNVPIHGGVGPNSVTRYNYPTLAATIAPFLLSDRCTPAPRRNDRAPLHVSTFNCAAGAGVTVAVVDGMDHQWPGARSSDPVRKLKDKVAPPPLDATTFLWSHLRSSTTIS